MSAPLTPAIDLRDRVLADLQLLEKESRDDGSHNPVAERALIAVVELHRRGRHYFEDRDSLPTEFCEDCSGTFPCETIRIIAKELGIDE